MIYGIGCRIFGTFWQYFLIHKHLRKFTTSMKFGKSEAVYKVELINKFSLFKIWKNSDNMVFSPFQKFLISQFLWHPSPLSHSCLYCRSMVSMPMKSSLHFSLHLNFHHQIIIAIFFRFVTHKLINVKFGILKRWILTLIVKQEFSSHGTKYFVVQM